MRVFLRPRLVLSSVVCHQRRASSNNSRLGVSPEFIAFIQQDIDFRPSTIRRWARRQRWLQLKEEHEYDREAVSLKGHDLAAAHLIINHGGTVKFVGKDKWFKRNKEGQTFLPNKLVKGFTLEAVDASTTTFMYSTLDYFERLTSLKYLNLSECPHVDDWCLARLHMLSESLRFLDVSGCPRVTERGLATLHHLEHLEGLNISDMPKVENPQLMTILMEEMLPKCAVVGPDYLNTDQPEHSSDKEQSESPLISDRVMAIIKDADINQLSEKFRT